MVYLTSVIRMVSVIVRQTGVRRVSVPESDRVTRRFCSPDVFGKTPMGLSATHTAKPTVPALAFWDWDAAPTAPVAEALHDALQALQGHHSECPTRRSGFGRRAAQALQGHRSECPLWRSGLGRIGRQLSGLSAWVASSSVRRAASLSRPSGVIFSSIAFNSARAASSSLTCAFRTGQRPFCGRPGRRQ